MSIARNLFRRTSRARVVAAALAAAVGLGFAASVAAAPLHHETGRHGFRGMEKLHGNLKLSAEQEALWQKARAQMKQNAQAARDRHTELRGSTRAALDKPNVDFRALAEQMDRAREQDIAARRQVRDQWLALYDSLDQNQKEQVRVFVKERVQRGEKFRAKMRERWESRGKADK